MGTRLSSRSTPTWLSSRGTYFEQPSNHPIEHVPFSLATHSNAANKEKVWSGILRVRRHTQVRRSLLFSGLVEQRPGHSSASKREKTPFLSTPGVTELAPNSQKPHLCSGKTAKGQGD